MQAGVWGTPKCVWISKRYACVTFTHWKKDVIPHVPCSIGVLTETVLLGLFLSVHSFFLCECSFPAGELFKRKVTGYPPLCIPPPDRVTTAYHICLVNARVLWYAIRNPNFTKQNSHKKRGENRAICL